METNNNNLKKISKFLMILAAYHAFSLVRYCMNLSVLDTSALDDMSLMVMPAISVMGGIPDVLSVLVYVFLCFKGHQEANDPSSAKLHIILALVWMIGSVLSVIGQAASLVSGVTLMMIVNLLFAAASVVLLFFYRKYAKEICTEE